ncbi:MAG: hypothetical protein EZS28_032529, partial [Streblomastix strix]
MLNQLDVQYDPKSTKPVLEQLLLQTIKAQGYNRPKSNVTKINQFVHNAVATKNKQNNEQINDIANDSTNNSANNEANNCVTAQGNEETNEQDDEQDKKCNQKLFNRTSAHFGRDLKTHLESYKGPDQQKHPQLDKLAQPFMPYLKSNKTIQKLFATGQTKLFTKDQEQGVSDILQPTKNYMCIDAETVEAQDQED